MRSGYDEEKWWTDLPKLTTLTTEGDYSGTFEYPRHITLQSISYHSILTNRHALSHYCYSWQGKCFQIQENRSHQEFLFLLSLIPRYDSRSFWLFLFSSFFHTHLSSKPFTQFLINPFVTRLLHSWQTKTSLWRTILGWIPTTHPSSIWRMNNKHLFKTIPLSLHHQEHNPPKTPHLPLNPLPHLHSSSQNDSHAWTPWQESKTCEPTASLSITSHPLTHS